MKLLFILPGSETTSGPCKTMLRLANALGADVFSFKDHSLSMPKMKLLWKSPFWAFDLLKTVRKDYDYFVVNAPSSGSFLGTVLGKTIVYLGGVPEERKDTLKRQLLIDAPLKSALRKASLVWYNDDPEVERYARAHSSYCIEVRNSVDTSFFVPRKREGFTVGMVGPFTDRYNKPPADYIIERSSQLNAKLTLLENLTEKEYAKRLAELDVLLVPRFVETRCPQSKVLEAMSSGVTVIQTSLSGIPKGAKDGKHLFVSSVDAMISVANMLEENREYCKIVGRNARELILQNYSIEQAKERMVSSLLAREHILGHAPL